MASGVRGHGGDTREWEREGESQLEQRGIRGCRRIEMNKVAMDEGDHRHNEVPLYAMYLSDASCQYQNHSLVLVGLDHGQAGQAGQHRTNDT
jgi:hypothetical protein